MLKVKNTFIDSVAWDDEEAELGPPMVSIKSCPVRVASEEETDEPWWEQMKHQATLDQPTLCSEESCPAESSPASVYTAPAREVRETTTVSQEIDCQAICTEVPRQTTLLVDAEPVQHQIPDGGAAVWPVFIMVPSCPAQPQEQQQVPQQQQQLQLPQQPQTLQQPQQLLLQDLKPRVQKQQAAPVSSEVVPPEVRKPESSIGSNLHGTGECRPCAWFWRPQGCTNGVDCRHCHMCLVGEVKARRKTKIAAMRSQGHDRPAH